MFLMGSVAMYVSLLALNVDAQHFVGRQLVDKSFWRQMFVEERPKENLVQ
jgi:hypothetical protein